MSEFWLRYFAGPQERHLEFLVQRLRAERPLANARLAAALAHRPVDPRDAQIAALREALGKVQIVDREKIIIGPTSWGFIHLKLSSDHWAAADEWTGLVRAALGAQAK